MQLTDRIWMRWGVNSKRAITSNHECCKQQPNDGVELMDAGDERVRTTKLPTLIFGTPTRAELWDGYIH